jgi:hypothetical protein
MKWRLRRGDRPRRSGLEKDGQTFEHGTCGHIENPEIHFFFSKFYSKKKIWLQDFFGSVAFGQTEIFLRMVLYSFFFFFSTNLSLNLKLKGFFSQKIHLIITDWPTWIKCWGYRKKSPQYHISASRQGFCSVVVSVKVI